MYRSVQLNLRVKPGLKATLANLAKQDRRTLSAYVEKLLEDHVAKLKRQNQSLWCRDEATPIIRWSVKHIDGRCL